MALPQDTKTLMRGQIGRSSHPFLQRRLHHLPSSKVLSKKAGCGEGLLRLNVDVTSLIELPVCRGAAHGATLNNGNSNLHNGQGSVPGN